MMHESSIYTELTNFEVDQVSEHNAHLFSNKANRSSIEEVESNTFGALKFHFKEKIKNEIFDTHLRYDVAYDNDFVKYEHSEDSDNNGFTWVLTEGTRDGQKFSVPRIDIKSENVLYPWLFDTEGDDEEESY